MVGLLWAILASSAKAVREIVTIEEPQPAQRVEGYVFDAAQYPVSGVTVTDRANDGSVLRSTTTDAQGYFKFRARAGKTLYCLRFDHPSFNPLQLRLKLDKHAPHKAIVARPEIGG
jgi:hypothetical protein